MPAICRRDRRPYKTSDGYICVIVYNDKQWQNFFDATGRDDLRTDPKFATFAGRATNIDVVYAELARILETKTTAEWIEDPGEGRRAGHADARSRKPARRSPHRRDRFLPGRRSSDRGPDPQHAAVGALFGDAGRNASGWRRA